MTRIQQKINILENYISGKLTAADAATLLGMSIRTIYRKVHLLEDGVNPFSHGNKAKEPANKIPEATRALILRLIKEKYFDLPYCIVTRLFKSDEGIAVSKESIRKIVVKEEEKKKKKIKINTHPVRRRRSQFGELIQIDGSPHYWFGRDKPPATLLVFVDDATGKITAARFEKAEDSAGYRQLIFEHVLRYGIPLAFYSDRFSAFTEMIGISKTHTKKVATQYQRICFMLGIETIYALTPQAKGRVERLNQTLQGRWPGLFRLRGIDTIEKANAKIKTFIEDFNTEFGVEPRDPEDAHVPNKDYARLYRICAQWYEKTLSKNKNFIWKGQIYQLDKSYENKELTGHRVYLIVYDDGCKEVVMPDKRFENKLSLMRFRILDRKQQLEIMSYEESAKSIDARIDQIIKEHNKRGVNNGFYWKQQVYGDKRKQEKKRREATQKAANLLIEKVLANKKKPLR